MLSPALRYNAGILRANGTPFPVNSATSSGTFCDRQGNPISSDKLKRVDAIHRTDWQGKQLLYPAARTNCLPMSEQLDQAPWFSGNATFAVSATTQHFGGADGPVYTSISRQTANASSYRGIYSSPAAAAGTRLKLTFALRAGAASSAMVGIYNSANSWGNGAGGTAHIISGPGAVASYAGTTAWLFTGLSTTQDTLCEISRVVLAGDAATYGAFIYPTSPGDLSSKDILATRFMLSSDDGAYIITASAPVTVTDYTLSGSTVNFGQVPASGAVCDWTGVARR